VDLCNTQEFPCLGQKKHTNISGFAAILEIERGGDVHVRRPTLVTNEIPKKIGRTFEGNMAPFALVIAFVHRNNLLMWAQSRWKV
jgi:hypothetical protein